MSDDPKLEIENPRIEGVDEEGHWSSNDRNWGIECECGAESFNTVYSRANIELLIARAEALADLHDGKHGWKSGGVSIDARGVERGAFGIRWFSEHRGHRMRPRNPEGVKPGACGKLARCVCKHRMPCFKPAGHDGECSTVWEF